MIPVVNGLQEAYGDRVSFVSLDAKNEGQAAFQRLSLPGHPALLIFDANGAETYRGFGIIEEAVLRAALTAVIE